MRAAAGKEARKHSALKLFHDASKEQKKADQASAREPWKVNSPAQFRSSAAVREPDAALEWLKANAETPYAA
jgi:hypothetical protein